MSVETGATFFLSHLYFLFVKAKYKERGTVLAEDQIVQVSFCEFCPLSETIKPWIVWLFVFTCVKFSIFIYFTGLLTHSLNANWWPQIAINALNLF